MAYLIRLVRDRAIAEDLSQEVLVRFLQHGRSIRNESSLRAWLYAVGRHQAFRYLRRRSAPLRPTPSIVCETAGPEEEAGRMELGEILQHSLQRLKEPYRTTMVLIGLEGMSYERAARVMECSLNTVCSRSSRARKQLRKWIEPYWKSALGKLTPS